MKEKNKTINSKSISQSEAKILHVLWHKQPLNGKQIAEQLASESWSYVTVKTLINRLLKKGFLDFDKQGRQYLYSTVISKNDYLKTENSSFIQRMYNGSFSGLFASFSEQENISKKELEEIKQMIKQMEQDS